MLILAADSRTLLDSRHTDVETADDCLARGNDLEKLRQPDRESELKSHVGVGTEASWLCACCAMLSIRVPSDVHMQC